MSCPVCDIAENKPDSVVYEDEKTIAFFAEKPKATGHVVISPKEHVEKVEEIPDSLISHFFYVASFAASALFEMFGGGGDKGTNIVLNEGKGSDRSVEHVSIDVIPRQADDGINYRWEPKQADQQELDEVLKKIKDHTFFIGKKKAQQPAPDGEEISQQEPKKAEAPSESNKGSENYLVKQLDRCP